MTLQNLDPSDHMVQTVRLWRKEHAEVGTKEVLTEIVKAHIPSSVLPAPGCYSRHSQGFLRATSTRRPTDRNLRKMNQNDI